MIEKQDLTKSLKKMEIQLSDLNQSNDKNNNDNNSEYFKRICCDVMANIEVRNCIFY